MITSLPADVQRDMLRTIPGMRNCHITRYGYAIEYDCIDPLSLNNALMSRDVAGLFFAGQMTGVEGYVESAASGIIAGRALADRLSGKTPLELPHTTMLGALCSYISDPTVENFPPMASSMGILPGLDRVIKGKQERYAALAQRALSDLDRALSDSEDT